MLPLAAREPLAKRIAHTDPAKYRDLQHVHGGAGKMNFMELLGRDALNTNLLFLHRGVIQPKSGIGHHFHNHMEEMFVILDGQAQFTIDGRTSLIARSGRRALPHGAFARDLQSHRPSHPVDEHRRRQHQGQVR